MTTPKPPYPDFNDDAVTKDDKYVGLAWMPTVGLRFVERQGEDPTTMAHIVKTTSKRILQQQWETRIINNLGYGGVNIRNPFYTQWRDVPLETE